MNSKEGLNKKYLSFLDKTKDDTHKAVNHLNDRVLIVDGLNTFIRSFAVNPSLNDDGLHIGGLVGFLKSIRYSSDVLKPSRIIIVFDGKGGSKKRRKILPRSWKAYCRSFGYGGGSIGSQKRKRETNSQLIRRKLKEAS